MADQNGLVLLGKRTDENGNDFWSAPIVNERQELVMQLNEEAIQSQQLGNGLEYFLYADGNENRKFEQIDVNNGSATKQRTHLAMVGNGQSGNTDRASFQTIKEIDLSNIDTLTIDWECISDSTSTGVRSFLYLFSRFDGSNTMVSETRRDSGFSRTKQEIDVSNLKGKYLIRFTTHSRTESSHSTELRVYSLSGKKQQASSDGTTSYYRYSSQSKPSSANTGDTLYEFDTKKVFIYDGSSWVEM